MSGFREIELREPCETCKGAGYFVDMVKVRILSLRPKDITKDELIPCRYCKGSGVIDTYNQDT